MFSNKVDLMETLISWVVCTTLLYSIVGTTITLSSCVDIMSARPDIITLLYSSIQCFNTLRCESAIRL